MMKAVLGLPLAQAKALLAGKNCEAEFTAGTVRLTVSFFDDTAEEEEKHE